jgi:DNA segregation ATPase FtsK/SpoIIIE-like protein
VLIDPKRVELSTYNGLPHLAVPVIVESHQASAALRWAVAEMERRYKILAGEGVRSIAFALTFRSPERTLTDSEVDSLMTSIRKRLETDHGARPR